MKKNLLFITLMILSLAACGGNKKSTLKVSDPQQPIEVGAGKEFSITLEANPTTGYHWVLVGELDKNAVEFVADSLGVSNFTIYNYLKEVRGKARP